MAEFDFEKWCAEEEISEKTKKKLVADDLNTIKSLKAFKLTEVKELGLTRGQAAVVEEAIKSLQAPLTAPPHDGSMVAGGPTPLDPTTKTLAKDAELNRLLTQLGNSHLNDLLSRDESEAEAAGQTGERAHQIMPTYLIISANCL